MSWQWRVLPAISRLCFRARDETPVAEWARAKIFLSRKVTTKPGFYDPDEFPWTWEFQDIFRTRKFDGEDVTQITWKKSSVAGVTEACLNGIRWIADNDPQNIIFSIDNRVEAGNINEIRLQPTLRQLGQDIFSDTDDDAGKFLLKLRRMLVYFLGSYSSGAFANKMCEIAAGDELEEHGKVHGDTSSVENLRSRLKSAARPLLILMSKPKMAGGPIDSEYDDGSQHVYEIPCPHCTAAAAGIPSGYQQLLRSNLRFDHCRDLLGMWDKTKILLDTYFECIHCHRRIEEHNKRWFNDRARRRWRRTNFTGTPGHISFHISDYYGYHPDAQWGKIALKIIKAKGDPVAMQGIRNHHDGLAWELRATRTTADDILACRQAYQRGYIPRKPWILLTAADVGLAYVKWATVAFARDGEAWVIDWGEEQQPEALLTVMRKTYPCAELGKPVGVTLGYCDGKYRKEDVHKACLASNRRLWPIAGTGADGMVRSITFSHVPHRPQWFGVTLFIDRDAKHEFYTERIKGWVDHRKAIADHAAESDIVVPNAPPLWFPENVRAGEQGKTFVAELCNENLIRLENGITDYLPDSKKEYVWKRSGPNHWGDAIKTAIVGYRWLTRSDAPTSPDAAVPSV